MSMSDPQTTITTPLPQAESVTLGTQEFVVKPMPWGQLSRLTNAINRVGAGLATGQQDDGMLAEMAKVITIGLGITVEDLEAIPAVSMEQASEAFNALMRVSGMERVLERRVGEARRRAQAMAPAPTPGTDSMLKPTP